MGDFGIFLGIADADIIGCLFLRLFQFDDCQCLVDLRRAVVDVCQRLAFLDRETIINEELSDDALSLSRDIHIVKRRDIAVGDNNLSPSDTGEQQTGQEQRAEKDRCLHRIPEEEQNHRICSLGWVPLLRHTLRPAGSPAVL